MNWARRRRLRVASRGHAVVCQQSHAVLMVDFVFEEEEGQPCKNKQAGKRGRRRKSFLACVYSAARRGGMLAKYAVRYMQMVQRVCNQVRDFSSHGSFWHCIRVLVCVCVCACTPDPFGAKAGHGLFPNRAGHVRLQRQQSVCKKSGDMTQVLVYCVLNYWI